MFKVSRKIVQDEFDSADDLEMNDSMEDDVISFQKIPATQTKLNAHLFSAPSHAQEDVVLKDVQNSMVNPQNNNQQPRGKKTGAKSFQGEPIKQKNYSTGVPKQHVVDENVAYTQKATPARPGASSNSISPYSKTYSHLVDKENVNYEEQNNFITSNFENPPESSAYTELANKIYSEKFLSNSQARKTNVAKSSNPHLLLSPDEARKIEEKRYLGSRELQENVVNRLTNNQNQNQSMEHSRIRENSYIDRNTEECTFTPSIISNKPRRELSQFLEDQKQYQDQSQAKIKKKQEEIQSEQTKAEPTYKPEICANSKKILARKQKEKTPVYQRLYNVGKNAQAKHMQGIAEREDFFSNRESLESSQFIGQINTRGDLSTPTSLHGTESLSFIPTIHKKSKKIVRDDKVENLLYYDALRRQHKVVENSKNTKKTSSVAPLSSASKRAVATRFIKEFDIGILEFLEIDKEPKLNYLQLNEFLKKLCFLKESEYIENPHFTPERLLLYDMWYLLRADQYKGIHRRNLLMFLLAVMDLYFPITKIQRFDETNRESQEDNSPPENPEMAEMIDQYGNPVLPEEEGFVRERKNIGLFDEDGNLELNEDEVRKVHKVFELWYINRMCSADNIGQLIKLRNYEEPTHQPRINESSKRLAQNYREKMLGGTAELIQQNKIPAPKDGKLTHADLLIISKKISTEKVNKFGELLEEEKNRGCTFKPHITQYDSTQSMSSVRSPNHSRRQAGTPVSQASKNRVFELYSLAKPRVLKQDKNAEEHDFEKNYQECTFQPNVNLKREKTQRKETADLYVKGIDKTVERMRQARAEREQKNNQLQRGFTTGKEGHFVFTNDKKKFSGLGAPFDQYALMRRNYPGESYQGEYEEEMYDYEQHGHAVSANEAYNQAQVMRGDDNPDTHPYTATTYEQQTLDSRNYDYNKDERQSSHHTTNPRHQEIAELQKDEEYEEHEEHGEEEEEHEQEEEQEEGEDDGRVPLLFVDVNLGQGRTERIVVYEGDSPEELAQKFSEEHNLDISMKGRLIELLESQIAGLLSRIDEEATSNHSETDRQKYNDNFGQFDQIQEEDDYND